MVFLGLPITTGVHSWNWERKRWKGAEQNAYQESQRTLQLRKKVTMISLVVLILVLLPLLVVVVVNMVAKGL